MKRSVTRNPFNIIVIVAALGYFVDIYDLILFGLVKNKSLMAIGITNPDLLFSKGNFLLSMQMAGMLIGGIVFGIMGDRRGRLSTLFVTISLYSLANIANGFIQNVEQYAVLRFISGFGLSGELGVGITLVSEVMTKERRAIGASIVSGIGIAGAALGFLIVEEFNWRVAYWSGGGLGLLLLLLRLAVFESGMYERAKTEAVAKGDFFSLFTNIRRFKKFILGILVALPCWYTVSVLAINASSFAGKALGITGTVTGTASVMWHYIGASIGSFFVGYMSNKLRSRRKTLLLTNGLIAALTAAYFLLFHSCPTAFYTVLFLIGIPMGGLWTIFMTTVSEQFGTNLRATVTTSSPNFVRGGTILITFLLGTFKLKFGLWNSGVIVGIIFIGAAILAAFFVEETYGKELDYMEE